MTRIFLVLVLVATAWFWLQIRNQPDPKRRRELTIKAATLAVATVLLYLALTGRMHWLGLLFAGIIPAVKPLLLFALRNFPLLASLYKRFGPTAAPQQSSEVRARYIVMRLDHETGELSGNVLAGPACAGSQLSDLDQAQLAELLSYCKSHDADSARLLETYLEQRFGESFETDGAADSDPGQSSESIRMTRAEALAILGLVGEPSHDEVVAAHRKLMQKLHPDRGGNDYLAGKINAARDYLLAN